MTSKYAVAAHNEFIAASNEALQTPNLQLALSRLGETLAAGNKSAFEKLPGSSLLRDKARAIKDETLAHLDVHLQTLERAVQAKGGHVHYAADAADANEIVERIARERGIRRVVKSKSMVTARGYLRQKFARSEMGVTGGNFLVAETGAGVLISNEGNARLTTSVPRVMVSVVGIEKVIPKLSDLPIFLKVLARAATGQKLSIYTSMITGPRREGEGDGPEEFHLVLLDNGRSRILGGPSRESLFCIRCGACLNICPVYRKIGGHAYGSNYSGPIGAVISPLYDGLKQTYHQPHASSLCGACQAACPVKIQIPELLIRNREAQHEEHVAPAGEELIYRIWSWVMRRPRLYRWAARIGAWTMGAKARQGWVAKLPGPLAGWTAHRDFPVPASQPFRDRWAALQREEIPVTNPVVKR